MLKVNNLIKCYNDKKILDDISFEVAKGGVLSIIGSSGSGKSTILRCINGLEKPDSGEIIFDKNSNVGTIFQHFNLFPHKTLFENIAYVPIYVKKLSPADVTQRCYDIIEEFDISREMMDKYPSDISGGQKQRIAIIRTLMTNPDIILFDEPTSALDPENTKDVLNAVKKLVQQGITIIIVTHEMKFAEKISDNIMFIDEGKVLECTNTKDFFKSPTSKRAQEFLENIKF